MSIPVDALTRQAGQRMESVVKITYDLHDANDRQSAAEKGVMESMAGGA